MKNNLVNNFKKNGVVQLEVFNNLQIELVKKEILNKLNKSYKKLDIKKLDFFNQKEINSNIDSKLLNPLKRYIDFKKKIFLSETFKSNINKFLKEYWGNGISDCKILWVGPRKTNLLKNNKIGFRIVMPNKKKQRATIHTDAISKYFDSFVTLWIPLLGFNSLYTPGYSKKSHLRYHPKEIYQNQLNSKALNYIKNFKFTRPIVRIGNGVIHHPNILHGNGVNLGNMNRVSIEIRIFNLKKYKISQIYDKKFFSYF
jgi:hypothetical protein